MFGIESLTLTTVYWVALAAGVGLLVVSVLLGDVFDFLDAFDFDVGGTELSFVPVFFTAVATFGAGGLIGIEGFGLNEGGSIVTGLGTGVLGGGLAGLLFAALKRQESTDTFELTNLVGCTGRLSLGAGPGKTGKVTVTYDGMSRSYPARSNADLPSGAEVVVSEVVGSQLTVERRGTVT